MGRQLRKAVMLACAIGVCGCAAREVTPVRMAQPGDDELGCPAIKQQIADNDAAALKLLHKDKQVENANTAKTIGSALPGVGLLLLGSNDFSNEEQVKARALIDRNERLNFLVKQKGC